MSELVIDNKSGTSAEMPRGQFFVTLFKLQNELFSVPGIDNPDLPQIMAGAFEQMRTAVLDSLASLRRKPGIDNEQLMNTRIEGALVNLFIYNRLPTPELRKIAISIFSGSPEEVLLRTSDLFLYTQVDQGELGYGKFSVKESWDRAIQDSLYSGNASSFFRIAGNKLQEYGIHNLHRILEEGEKLSEDVVDEHGFCVESGEKGLLERANRRISFNCETLLRGIRNKAKSKGKSVQDVFERINQDSLSWI